MLKRLFSLARISPAVGLSFIAGALTVVVVQLMIPNWRYEKLHYQKGKLSVQTLVRVDPYSGEVERLVTSEPE